MHLAINFNPIKIQHLNLIKKNQEVKLEYDNEILKVIALQNKSTPSIIIKTPVLFKRNAKYEFIVKGKMSNNDGSNTKAYLWVNNMKVNYPYIGSSNTVRSYLPEKQDNMDGFEIIGLTFQNTTSSDFDLNIGILFENPCKQAFFEVSAIVLIERSKNYQLGLVNYNRGTT